MMHVLARLRLALGLRRSPATLLNSAADCSHRTQRLTLLKLRRRSFGLLGRLLLTRGIARP